MNTNSATTPRIVRELSFFFEQFPDVSFAALAVRAGLVKSVVSKLMRRAQKDIGSADADALRCAMAEIFFERATDNKKADPVG